MRLLLLAQAASTLPLVGLIWTVQIVQYPLFARVGDAAFASYHAGHSQRITFVVLPLMLVELVSASMLVLRPGAPVSRLEALVGLALVGALWLSTAFLQVPRHQELTAGFDAAAHHFLVVSNWLRTVAWTARGGLVLWWLSRM